MQLSLVNGEISYTGKQSNAKSATNSIKGPNVFT